MGKCPNDKMLSRYLDGELGPRAAEGVRRHLAACEKCAERYEAMHGLENVLRATLKPTGEAPDVASHVVSELGRRGAFFRARVTEGKRRLLGTGLASWRMGAALAAALGVVLIGMAGMDYVSRWQWVRRTEPVLADAERILVRLVYVRTEDESHRLAWAREEVRKLELAQRLGKARAEADAPWAKDLATLESTFALLAGNDPVPESVVGQLSGGELLAQASRMRETLARGG